MQADAVECFLHHGVMLITVLFVALLTHCRQPLYDSIRQGWRKMHMDRIDDEIDSIVVAAVEACLMVVVLRS